MKAWLAGLLICTLLFLPADLLRAEAAEAPLELRLVTNSVLKHGKIEFSIEGLRPCTNAFNPDETRVDLRLIAPSGAEILVPAFYYQPYLRERRGSEKEQRDWIYPKGFPQWIARYSPAEIGTYQVSAVSTEGQLIRKSSKLQFCCLPSDSKGFLRVGRKDRRFMEFTDGTPFFAIGQNVAFVGSQQYVTLSKAESIFARLGANGANYVRLWTCCDDWAMAIEARKSAWGRSWDWRPPMVPLPDSPSTNLQCLKISASPLKVEPSHPVALLPRTRYVLIAKVRAEANARVFIAVGGQKTPIPSIRPDSWSEVRHEFENGEESWLQNLTFVREGQGTAWVADVSLKEAAGGPELLWEAVVNRPARGIYNPLDSFLLDELVASAKEHGIFLQLTLLTRDLYMFALKNPSSAEYGQAIRDAKKFLRYAVARWGYSTSVAAWEYWNEMDPNLPTERFYQECGDYLQRVDPYDHLRTTSTWGPSAKDCKHEELDIADTHFYLRPTDRGRLDNEVDAIRDRTLWLREQAPAKPVHLGEFGIADEKWALTDEMKRRPELVDVHNALWASALSGASGTGLFWWWERLDQRGVYPLYRPISRFVADVPWNSGEVRVAELRSSKPELRVFALQAGRRVWVWVFNPEAAWKKVVTENKLPSSVVACEIEMRDVPEGNYYLRWWNTRDGTTSEPGITTANDGLFKVNVPGFDRDIAFTLSPAD